MKEGRLREIIGRIDPDWIREQASRVTSADFTTVRRKAEDIEQRVVTDNLLHRTVGEVRLGLEMVRNYVNGRYRRMPYWAISAVVFSLLYVLNPFDLIPDFIPGLGQVDDLAVLTACFYLIRRELDQYQEWKRGQQPDVEPIDAQAV